jgi:hypothetical protein
VRQRTLTHAVRVPDVEDPFRDADDVTLIMETLLYLRWQLDLVIELLEGGDEGEA